MLPLPEGEDVVEVSHRDNFVKPLATTVLHADGAWADAPVHDSLPVYRMQHLGDSTDSTPSECRRASVRVCGIHHTGKAFLA